MKKDSTLYKVVLLGVLCAICGLLLSAVNGITEPVIAAQAIAAEKENLVKIYPNAEFTEVTDFTDESGYVQKVFNAEGYGTIYKIQAVGYNANGFTFMIAFNDDGTCGGFTEVEQNETNGFGARCFSEEGYLNEINSITSTEDAPLLSGATLTSTAIQKGVAAAQALFNASN